MVVEQFIGWRADSGEEVKRGLETKTEKPEKAESKNNAKNN
jgi:hypothetical protein